MTMLQVTRTFIKMAIKAQKEENNTIDVLENFSQQLMWYAGMIDQLNTFKLNVINRPHSPVGFCQECGNNISHETYPGWDFLKREVEEENLLEVE